MSMNCEQTFRKWTRQTGHKQYYNFTIVGHEIVKLKKVRPYQYTGASREYQANAIERTELWSLRIGAKYFQGIWLDNIWQS